MAFSMENMDMNEMMNLIKTTMESMDLSSFNNLIQNKDLDEQFEDALREMPNRRFYTNFYKTPHIYLSDKLIDELENKLMAPDISLKQEQKEKSFQKFYDEVLKSSFEDMLKIRAPLLNTTYPEGTFKNFYKNLPPTALQIQLQKKLPVFKYREAIIDAVENHTFVLIKGETGSGKTTQIPQMILDHYAQNGRYCHIICTQPRRISAVSIAERVAFERNEQIGESVGYQIRLEHVPPKPVDSILYCTTGILLRMMVSDPILSNISHVIIDEIHERNIDSDLLIGLIQLVVKYNKQIKVLLMSATFGFEEFSKNFSNFKIINVEGTLHPVQTFYLEDILNDLQFFDYQHRDMYLQKRHPQYYRTPEGRAEMRRFDEFSKMINEYTAKIANKYSTKVIETLKNPFSEEININLIEKLVDYIDRKMPDGAILIFLPGYEKIFDLYDLLTNIMEQFNKNYLIYPLHSMLPTDEQKGIFDKPEKGVRKIILATNIAETSITIDDIVYVINTGKEKVKYYDIKNKIETLEEYFITKASAIQRQGRAGRCQPGICFNLFTKIREEKFAEYPIPEIQRTRMESVIMTLKSLKIHDVKTFLKSLISAPDIKIVENGITFLQKINALDKDEVMTPLGLHLADLPVDPQIGKMLLMATVFKCVDPITTVTATLSLKEPYRKTIKKTKEEDEAKKEFAAHSRSDHIAYINVIKQYREAYEKNNSNNFCKENYIVKQSCREIEKMKIQLCELLQSKNFIRYTLPEHSDINTCSEEENIIRAVLTAGLYPNIAVLRTARLVENRKTHGTRIEHTIQTPEDGIKVKINITSVNRNETTFNSKFFVYFNKHKSRDMIFLRECSMISTIPIIIFADFVKLENSLGDYYLVVGDNVLKFPTNQRTGNLLIKLRQRFEKIIADLAINPQIEIMGSDKNVIDALKTLFIEDSMTSLMV